MTAILIVVIAIIIISGKQAGQLPAYLSVVDKMTQNSAMIEHKFYSKPFRCSLTRPDSTWIPQFENDPDSSKLLEEQPFTLVSLLKWDKKELAARVELNLSRIPLSRTVEQVALMDFTKRTANYDNDKYEVIREVTQAGGVGIIGAYYVVDFSPETDKELPILVSMFFVRKEIVYNLICSATADSYDAYKTDFENILKNFAFY